ncbi:MAG: hypothetical protein QUS12_07660 [Methanosarcina sp.]|nr:hypothetical protein [Methanosarcina sp.]
MSGIGKEEVGQIIEEIENDEELGTEENELSEEEIAELDEAEEEFEDEEEEEDEEDGFEDEESSIVKNITIIQQPVITEVTVGAETGAKGEVKPYAKLSITRHLEFEGDEFNDVINIIADDFAGLADEVESELLSLKKRLNMEKPEMQ